MSDPRARMVRALARASGIGTSYLDYGGKRVAAKSEAMLSMIARLHPECAPPADPDMEALSASLRLMRESRARRGLPPVIVAWEGIIDAVWIWADAGCVSGELILTPDGDDPVGRTSLTFPVHCHEHSRRISAKHNDAHRLKLSIAGSPVPFGYYAVRLQTASGTVYESFLISAPRRLPTTERCWGLFSPAYALRSENDWGIGGYGELRQACDMVRAHKGTFFGTLPLLIGDFCPESFNISPYSPLSRLFWNEIFIDMDDLPGGCPEITLQDRAEIATLRETPLADYQRVHALKSRILMQAAQAFDFAGDEGFAAWSATKPMREAYLAFQVERAPETPPEDIRNYHLYVQYACHLQLDALRSRALEGKSAALYLDYPIGIDSNGFEAQALSHLFMPGYQVGAPPDLFFDKGQTWGFRPFHPRAFEQDRFRYFRATIDHFFRYAGMLRLDHVMGFYRIYCVPDGGHGGDGVYIRYPFEALMAVLCLEAHRHGGLLIGEDLGTVPDAVKLAMETHAMNRMWIFQFELAVDPQKSFGTISPSMIASLNTHDMFPLRAWLTGDDLERSVSLSLLDRESAAKIWKDRQKLLKRWSASGDVFDQAIEGMAKSPARFLSINIEDMWDELAPQNIPGTTDQYPNWRKKLEHPVADWARLPRFEGTIALLNRYRTHE